MRVSPHTNTADRRGVQRDDEATAPRAVLVGSALILPTVVLVGFLAVAVLRSATPDATGNGLTFLAGVPRTVLRPEPGEQHAYLVSLLAPLALSAAFVTLHHSGRLLRLSGTRGWLPLSAVAGQSLVLSLIVDSLLRQQALYAYFHDWQLVVAASAAILVAIAVVVPGSLSVFQRLVSFSSQTASAHRGHRRGLARSFWFALALLATLSFLSTTIYSDGNIALAPKATWSHLPFTLEEFSAVLDGRTPLVDFTPQYTSVLPYIAEPILNVAGLTIGSFTTLMALLSAAALMSVFVALVRVTGRPSVATLLFLPFLAMTFFPAVRGGAQVHTVGSYYAQLPLRYAFPFLLTALVVTYAVSPRRWRSALTLGAVTGAGLVNNVEFGLAAVGAVIVSVFVAEAARHASVENWRGVASAELRVIAGMALAVAVFSIGTLVRSGALPDFGKLIYFSQQFATSGFYMLPMPGPFGLHLVIYLTFVLALVLTLCSAILCSTDDVHRSRLALLTYSAVFGLGAGSYYVGRSHPLVLISIFAAWVLCVVVLAAEVGAFTREILAAPSSARWLLAAPSAGIVGLLVLCASALSFDDFILGQPQRIASQAAPKIFAAFDMERFVASCTRTGDDVMMIFPLGHRIAHDNGVNDHFPYNHPGSVVTTQQVTQVVRQLRSNRVSAVFSGPLAPELATALGGGGYHRVLERRQTIPSDKSEVTGAAPLVLWRRSGDPVGCR